MCVRPILAQLGLGGGLDGELELFEGGAMLALGLGGLLELREHGGAALIEEYCEKAPAIVNCINLCDVPEERYAELRSRWLEPCYRALQEERFEDCRDSYVDMVRTLERRYLS